VAYSRWAKGDVEGLGDEARSLPEGNTFLLMNYERLNFDVLEEN